MLKAPPPPPEPPVSGVKIAGTPPLPPPVDVIVENILSEPLILPGLPLAPPPPTVIE
jgi:hypothetical protein